MILPVSAQDKESLRNGIQALAGVADGFDALDLAYTLSARRSKFYYRGFTVAGGENTVSEALGDVTFGEKLKGMEKGLVLVFTGQGAQWRSMGKNLIEDVPEFKRTIQELDVTLKALPWQERPVGWSLEGMLVYFVPIEIRMPRANLCPGSRDFCTQ